VARWLIPSEFAEALSTDRRVTCSIEEIPAAALIAIRCTTPSIPIDPIAMNTVRIPSNASVTSRGSSRWVGRMCSLSGSPKARRALPGSRTIAATASPRASTPRTIAADAAGGADHCCGHRVFFRQVLVRVQPAAPYDEVEGGRRRRARAAERETRCWPPPSGSSSLPEECVDVAGELDVVLE
jgi:hypothetical protein